MTANGYVQRFVRLRSATTGLPIAPPELRPKLVELAGENDANLTETIIQILAKRYKLAYEPNGRKTSPQSAHEVLNLRLPAELDRAVALSAASNGHNVQKEIISNLCAHVGLRPLTAQPRPRRPRAPRAPRLAG